MNIQGMFPEELKECMTAMGEKPFRARQLYSWMHEKCAPSYEVMTSLSKELRERLSRSYPLTEIRTVRKLTSKTDGTRKYLFALGDGNVIESVRMPYEHGISVCISTQVGCRMGCRFCASTIDGLVRSLTAAEMLSEVYQIQREEPEERVSHVVLMGSGEPLENFEEVLRFIRILSSPEGRQISQRNITLSTCGLVPEIRKLAEEKLAITLAVSLHAPNDEKRKKLMPVANKYPLQDLMSACRYYFDMTGRRLTFEYSLIEGVNDSMEDAAELVQLLKGFPAHVNLIPVNPVRERAYSRSGSTTISRFHKKLENSGINVTIRREMGSDIQGACGQLRKSYIETDQETKA